LLFNGVWGLLRYTYALLHRRHTPSRCKNIQQQPIATIKELAALPQAKTIVESDLDFNCNFSEPSDQEKAFEAQLELAAEL
jgi:Tat protein secretion system quality control protein TatD with DNase activity